MTAIIEKAAIMQKRAENIISDVNIVGIWSSIGATINLVGSLKMGLLIQNRDIDFHIYTNPFNLSESFRAIAELAENNRIKSMNYSNLLETDDRCIEWHASYEDPEGDIWQIDMIHILNDSPYAGYFEKVADRISAVLTPETRQAILTIKNTVPDTLKVMGIQVYKAVIADGIRDTDSFLHWMSRQPDEGIITWMP